MTTRLEAAAIVPPDAVVATRLVGAAHEPLDSGTVDAAYLDRHGFSGAVGDTLVVPGGSGPDELFVGIGEPDKLDTDAYRRVGAAIARAAKRATAVHVDLNAFVRRGEDVGGLAAAIGEGALLALYQFGSFKSESKPVALERLVLVADAVDTVEAALERAESIAAAVSLARDLVNTPAGDLSPAAFADRATQVATEAGIEIEVLDEEAIVAAGLGGLLGVAAGSEQPPRLVKLRYVPEGGSDVAVALVGKGITFDSGGLSLKPAASMMTMKTDMGGAAAVLGALSACRALGVGIEVRGYLPLTENMPGGAATRPGDVLHTRAGKTIEVLNTDAEGRLVLADALALAAEDGADAIVDLATLTGACVAALGMRIAGLLGNDDRLIAHVRRAAAAAGEAVWPLPLPAGYRSHIESDIADMKNIGATGQAGALSAALLLQEFVGDVPWAHLDIAGPVRSEEDRGYQRKGATGFGVRTLLELVGGYEALGGSVEGEAEGIVVLR